MIRLIGLVDFIMSYIQNNRLDFTCLLGRYLILHQLVYELPTMPKSFNKRLHAAKSTPKSKFLVNHKYRQQQGGYCQQDRKSTNYKFKQDYRRSHQKVSILEEFCTSFDDKSEKKSVAPKWKKTQQSPGNWFKEQKQINSSSKSRIQQFSGTDQAHQVVYINLDELIEKEQNQKSKLKKAKQNKPEQNIKQFQTKRNRKLTFQDLGIVRICQCRPPAVEVKQLNLNEKARVPESRIYQDKTTKSQFNVRSKFQSKQRTVCSEWRGEEREKNLPTVSQLKSFLILKNNFIN